MAEFFSMDEDWDLQAIVRGCSDDRSMNIQTHHDDFLFNFPDLYEASNNNNSVLVDELDDIYKPFHPIYQSFSSAEAILKPSNSFPEEVNLEPEEIKKVLEKEIVDDQSAKTVANAAKYKRRKNQNKRVVVEVTAEGLPSDLWAWRKYGQKPIKGSPYPRSYYRCSSSKGCLARKQVEQSCADPGMFIINYSGEHNHSQPIRRSSLAGTNRHKFSVPKKRSSGDSCPVPTAKEESSCSPPSDIMHSTTPLMPSIEEVLILQQPMTDEKIDGKISEEISNDVEFLIPDMMINDDDFFVGLEELDVLISDSAFYTCSKQQFR